MELITSLSNPRIKQVRALRQKKARDESGTFLVEGIHHTGEAFSAGWEVLVILHAPDLLSSEFAQNLLEHASRQGVDLKAVSPQVMDSLTEKDNPQGILAVVRQRSARLSDLRSPRRAVALISPQDPGNVGTILRTIDAVGVDVLLLLEGGVDLFHPGVVRASMGSLFWKPVVRVDFLEFVQWARAGNYQLIGSSAHGRIDSHELVPGIPWVLFLGNEQKGMSNEQVAAMDVMVALPMQGRVTSLNLAVAAGVLLYQFCK